MYDREGLRGDLGRGLRAREGRTRDGRGRVGGRRGADHAHRLQPLPLCPPYPTDTGALADGFDPFKTATGLEDLSLAAAGAAAGGAAAAAKLPAAGGGSKRPPLSSVMTLVPEHFPEELYSSKDMR